MYLLGSKYGTGNLRRHLKSCVRRDTRDVDQLLISQEMGTMSLGGHKVDPERFRELVAIAMIKHEFPFSFVEYEGIRAIFQYMSPDLNLVSRNTAKIDSLKYITEKKKQESKVCLKVFLIESALHLMLGLL